MADSRERFKDPTEIERALAENRRVREETKLELDAEREVLRALLVRGRAAGLSVTGMARAAGISRSTAHRLIREAKPRHRKRTGGRGP
jgi:DNA-binding MurR/RpiR family transcriptional regulator